MREILEISYLRKGDLLSLLGSDNLGQLWGHVEIRGTGTIGVGEMLLHVMQHYKTPDLLISKDWSHGFIRGEPHLVLGVLKSLRLQIGPDSLATLSYLK